MSASAPAQELTAAAQAQELNATAETGLVVRALGLKATVVVAAAGQDASVTGVLLLLQQENSLCHITHWALGLHQCQLVP